MRPRLRLTPESRRQVERIRDEWLGHALSTDPADRPAGEDAIERIYRDAGRPAPRFVWTDSPKTALQEVSDADPLWQLSRRQWPTPREVEIFSAKRLASAYGTLAELPKRVAARTRTWLTRPLPYPGSALVNLSATLRGCRHEYLLYSGQNDADAICVDLVYRALGIARLRPEHDRHLDLLASVARSCGPWLPFPGVCVLVERPVRSYLEPYDGELALHRVDGPALVWRDGFGVHAWHGIRVLERYTAGEVDMADWHREINVERRRVLAELIGYERLLRESGAERIATDGYGTLWRIPTPAGQEDLVVVDVLNSTPEPDGSRRRYLLRTPPGLRSPRDAIGWTFGLPPGTYQPLDMT